MIHCADLLRVHSLCRIMAEFAAAAAAGVAPAAPPRVDDDEPESKGNPIIDAMELIAKHMLRDTDYVGTNNIRGLPVHWQWETNAAWGTLNVESLKPGEAVRLLYLNDTIRTITRLARGRFVTIAELDDEHSSVVILSSSLEKDWK